MSMHPTYMVHLTDFPSAGGTQFNLLPSKPRLPAVPQKAGKGKGKGKGKGAGKVQFESDLYLFTFQNVGFALVFQRIGPAADGG